MTYVISDLHGYPLKKFQKLLAKANFCPNDTLYILGDIIDRNGDGGIEMLCWLLARSNIHLILGNHEAMLLACDFLFNKSPIALDQQKQELLTNYRLSGGDVTLHALAKLNADSPEMVTSLFQFLRCAPLYQVVSIGTQTYLLVHSGLDNFCKSKKLSDYTPEDLLWAWPELEDVYYPNIQTIFGHTPTMSYDKSYRGKILKTKTWIDIDVGAGYGLEPVLLRLDDMQEFQNSP